MTVVLRRIKDRWEEMQRRYEMYHERGARFTAPGLFSPGKAKGFQRLKVQRSKVQDSKRLEKLTAHRL
jgi:hypothetical protein